MRPADGLGARAGGTELARVAASVADEALQTQSLGEVGDDVAELGVRIL